MTNGEYDKGLEGGGRDLFAGRLEDSQLEFHTLTSFYTNESSWHFVRRR